MATQHSHRQRGFALISVLLFLVLLSAVAVTLTYTAITDKRMSGSDQEGNEAYYAAEAGMEKMTADLGGLYAQNKSPKAPQIQNLGNSPPTLAGTSYLLVNGNSGYTLTVQANPDGSPVSHPQTISSGEFAGLSALIIPITLDVTATRVSGAQVHLTRDVEVAEIPVFQFGVFSDSDLSYFAGRDFDFAGRVHTNGDLYLSAGNGTTLTFHEKITASGEIIRQTLVNGLSTTNNYSGTVDVPTTANGCPGTLPGCRALALTEGSLTGGKGSAPTPGWDAFAQANYFNMLVRHAPTLSLPFVQDGAPIEIIRPPLATDSQNLSGSRLFNQAQIRVLLADTQPELPGTTSGGTQLDVADLCINNVDVVGTTCLASANNAGDSNWKRPPGTSGDWPLLNGWLRVEARQSDGTYKDVTAEWIQLGFARGLQTPDSEHGRANTVNPNAILILQQLKDTARGMPDCGPNPTAASCLKGHLNWLPLNFYDAREGERRENAQGGTACSVGGIMNAVEIDVGNLRKWLAGTIGSTGMKVESTSQNGYILYYADHRGMAAGPVVDLNGVVVTTAKHGDYGYEDFVNPNDPNGAANGTLDPGEDVNRDGILETNGTATIGNGFGVSGAGAGDPTTQIPCDTIGRINRVTGPRHAIVAVNGSLGNLPINFAAGGGGGFTIASEEPVYILGNYNAGDGANFGDPHAEAAVIADAVTLLSNNWNNEVSMYYPRTATNVNGATAAACPPSAALLASPLGYTPPPKLPGSGTGRFACTTSYRLAIASGKSIPFPLPAWASNTVRDFGTDGGVHNFLRYLEDWSGQTSNYQGSMVSLYAAQNAIGTFKCCNMVYTPPGRAYSFDTDFLDPSKMPPGTPRFIDINNVDVVQDMKPR